MKPEEAVRNLQAVTDAEIAAAKTPRESEARLREALAAARVSVWLSLELPLKHHARIDVLEERVANMQTTINLLRDGIGLMREIARRHGVELPDSLADRTMH